MKNVLSNDFKVFANRVAKIPFVKSLLRPIYYPYKRHLSNKRNTQFKKYAVNVLQEFDSIMASIEVDYSLAYGSMLGAVREHGFIEHDLDIDVFLRAEDYSIKIKDSLIASGFSVVHIFTLEDGKLGRAETYCKYDVSIDLFYVYPAIDSRGDYTCVFSPFPGYITWKHSQDSKGGLLVQKWDTPLSRSTIKMKFESLMLPVSSNYDELLKLTYGELYMVPDPNFHGEGIHCYEEWRGKIGILEK